jgi:hypothetical protein
MTSGACGTMGPWRAKISQAASSCARLAIPAAASIQIALYEWWEYRRELQRMRHNPPLPPAPAEART